MPLTSTPRSSLELTPLDNKLIASRALFYLILSTSACGSQSNPTFTDSETTQFNPTFTDSETTQFNPTFTDSETTQFNPTFTDSETTLSATDFDSGSGNLTDGLSGSTSGPDIPSEGICGDGKVDQEEECDDEEGSCTKCKKHRRVFVTSEGVMPEFASWTPDLSYVCNHYANLAGLLDDEVILGKYQGRFLPWLSTSSGLSPIDFIYPSEVPYVTLDGYKVADDWSALTSGSLLHPINVDEFGQINEVEVWTGTGPNGKPLGDSANCEGWTTTSIPVLGSWGHSSKSDISWTHYQDPDINPTTCAATFSIYCVESPETADYFAVKS